MDQDQAIHLMSTTIILSLIVSLPPIIVATLVGLCVALFQALTQMQDQTLPYALKLLATVACLLFAANLIFGELLNFTLSLFRDFTIYVR